MGLTTSVIAAIPTTIGTAEAVSAQRKEDAAAKKTAKFNISAETSDGIEYSVVLRGGFLYLQLREDLKAGIGPGGHPFTGYYFTHPGSNPPRETPEPTEGIVSTTGSDPPMLNWIFVDEETSALRHGTRTDSVGHLVGPWGWTEDEENVLLDDDEGFVVIWMGDEWQVFFDTEGDGSGLPLDMKIEGVCLKRNLLCSYGSKLVKDSERS